MSSPLILVSNFIQPQFSNQRNQSQIDSCIPRQDYLEIARNLDGFLSGYQHTSNAWHQWIHKLERYTKFDLAEAWHANQRLSKHNAVLSTSEKIALPLSALSYFNSAEIPHVVISHKLSSGLKSPLFRLWHLYKRFDHIICLCRAQADYAVHNLGMPESAVDFVYDKVDHQFFQPTGEIDEAPYILSVGKEYRDYATLLKAVAGTGIKVIVVASSPWSTFHVQVPDNHQSNLTIKSLIPFYELRALYAGARLVALPLFDVDFAAGVNTALETMAMGKPLIVSQTRGIADYIVERETGVFVPPGNAEALRDTILSLWDKPHERKRLGVNARQIVEEEMNLDKYVEQVSDIVRKTAAKKMKPR